MPPFYSKYLTIVLNIKTKQRVVDATCCELVDQLFSARNTSYDEVQARLYLVDAHDAHDDAQHKQQFKVNEKKDKTTRERRDRAQRERDERASFTTPQ